MNWLEKDKKYNWHPYSQEKTAFPPLFITKGKGSLLWDGEGNEYIDAISSWWCNSHGHCNAYISNKIKTQLDTLEHVLFGGVTHPLAIELSEKLISLLGNNQQRVFYSDNGSTAVEVAIKMCLQYNYLIGNKKSVFIAFENAFHGDTFAAMATSGISFFTHIFKDYFIDVKRIPLPNHENIDEVKNELKKIIDENQVAGFIFEPLVQGSSGMKMYEAKFLDQLIQICQENQVLTIADEVMTGFGRTGTLFASDQLKCSPDLFCFSKALTGGFTPMAITTCAEKIYQTFYDNDTNKAFFHGHTYTANPIGCAAAIASLDLTLAAIQNKTIDFIEYKNTDFYTALTNKLAIKNFRTKGIIMAFELDTKLDTSYYGKLRNELYKHFINNGILLRPIGNTIYIFPPYCISEDELKRIYDSILSLPKKIIH
jgi:adenosylmethionine---8-amino-7-oxononanoate aminotransferase